MCSSRQYYIGFVERLDKEIGERPSSFETMKYSRDVISMVLFLYETFDTYLYPSYIILFWFSRELQYE